MRSYIPILLFSFLMLSCANPQGPSEKPVRIAVLRGPSAMSMIRLLEKGFEFEGKKAVFTIYNEPLQVQALMMQNEADIALLPGNMAAILYNKGVNYKLVSVPVWGTLYLSGTDSLPDGWESLRGKKVYLMARGATPDLLFRKLLLLHHLEPDKDVRIDYTFPNHLELFTAVAAGRAPLAVLAEPFLSQAMVQNASLKVLLDMEKEWNLALADSIPMMQTAVMVQDDFLKQNGRWLGQFHKAYTGAAVWLHAQPDSAAIFCIRHGLLKDTLAAYNAILRTNIHVEIADRHRESISRYLRCLYEFNPAAVGGKLPDDAFIAKVPDL